MGGWGSVHAGRPGGSAGNSPGGYVFSYERVVGFYDDVQNSTDMMKTSLSAQFAGPLL